MKKYLVVLLALAMVFAFATTAFADEAIPNYTDVKADTEFANDIYRLTALGVLEGNNGWGGAYRPAEYLTRAEFAKIAVYMFGAEDTVNYYASLKSSFTDVAEGFWAEGYINAALDLGLMNGRGNGIFDPQAVVTTQEVATVVLRAVGYTDDLPGAWPKDYVTKAQNVKAQWSDETLFDYVEFIGPNAATRGEMAAIVNYALDLYQVTYVPGNFTVIYGASDVDSDGYAYDTLKTNEEDLFEYFLDEEIITSGKVTYDPVNGLEFELDVEITAEYTTKVTLLWNVFEAIEVPVWFEYWNGKLVEAAGWGYEDYADGELQFNVFSADDMQGVSVADNYYIYDETMDGELWNLSGRAAMLTMKVDMDDFDKEDLEGVEVAFVDLLTDVEYVTDGTKVDGVKVYNGNVYTTDDADDFVYNFDDYKDMRFGVVADIEEDLVEMHSGAAVVGENGVFCLLDDCKKHDLQFAIIKDGVMGDASLLEVNDIVYYAGDAFGADADEDVEVYVAFSPVEANLEELAATANSGIGEMTVSGVEYNYKENTLGALMSDDKADSFQKLDYDYLREILKEEDDDAAVLFAEAYAKTFAGLMIFDCFVDNTTYGVIVDITEDSAHIDGDTEWIYDTITIFGADGEETTYEFDEKLICTTEADQVALEAQFKVGDLVTFVVDGDEIVADSIGLKTAGRYNGYKVAFEPFVWAEDEMDINSKGVFRNDMKAYETYVNGVLVEQSYKGYSIDEDTVVFVVSTDDYEFDAVELGDAADYMGKETYTLQYGILDPADKSVDVLYLVDPDNTYNVGFGLLTEHYTKNDAEYVVIDGVAYEVEYDFADVLEDDEVYFVGYSVQKDKVSFLFYGINGYGDEIYEDDVVVLVDEFGYGFHDGNAAKTFTQVEAILSGIVEDYEEVAYITDRADLEDYSFAEDCVSYDMTGEHPGFNKEDYSFELEDIDHDDNEFDYIIIYDDAYEAEIAMIFAVAYGK
ncbi:MAG: S-layer homology domain-containing protein [Bacillota bacterium]|nr:S-layer homology domain-containing protein [Bacillota bacterium]